MKKTAFFIVLMALVAFSSSAQKLGVKAGANFATLAIDDDNYDPTLKPGMHIGVVGEFGISDNLFFEPGLFFSQKGTSYDVDGDYDMRMNYLDVPLNLKYKMGNFFLQGGALVGVGLNGTQQAGGFGEEDIEFGTGDNETKRLDFGPTVGLGMHFNKFQISANYTMGLRNLANIEDISVKNRVLSVSVGYYFGE
ncbi:MAG: porin family protein [Bacteroidales bacterium]